MPEISATPQIRSIVADPWFTANSLLSTGYRHLSIWTLRL